MAHSMTTNSTPTMIQYPLAPSRTLTVIYLLSFFLLIGGILWIVEMLQREDRAL